MIRSYSKLRKLLWGTRNFVWLFDRMYYRELFDWWNVSRERVLGVFQFMKRLP